MTPETISTIIGQVIFMIVTIVSIMVVPALIIGLIISVFQAATSINEQTLSFLPRLIVTLLALGFMGSWILKMLMNFTLKIIINIPNVIG